MLTIYVFTNGRQTYGHCLKSIDAQYQVIPIVGHTMMSAFAHILSTCPTDYFMKVDDDFFLHPRCIEYMVACVSNYHEPQKIGIFYSRLWEDFSGKSVDCVKIYNKIAMQKIGGPVAHPQTGRIDDATNATLVRAGHTNLKDMSVVGVHACSTLEEHDLYQQLWNKQAGRPWVKPTRPAIAKYAQTIDYQFELRSVFLEVLIENRGKPFRRYLNGEPVTPLWHGTDIKRADGHLLYDS